MKTKVIAFRVTQEEYDGLCFNAWAHAMKPSEFVLACLRQDIDVSIQALERDKKRAEAKAKRDAKKATVESPVMRNQRIKRERKAGHPDGVQ